MISNHIIVVTFVWFKPGLIIFCAKFQALETLRQISDGSVDDIEFPGNPSDFVQTSIKEEDMDDSKYFSNDYPLQGISYY